MKETNPIFRTFASLRQSFDESENSIVSSLRSVTQTVGSWFDENETAQVTRLMRLLDPNFDRESFERELREYIVPEVVDAYLTADKEALRAWCGDAVSPSSDSPFFIEPDIFPLRTDLQCPMGNNGAVPPTRPDQREQDPRYPAGGCAFIRVLVIL